MMTRAEAATPESSDMNASAQAEEASGETGFPRCELDRSTSFLEYLTLSWISPLLSIGALRPLTELDLQRWGIPGTDDADLCYSHFRKHWSDLEQSGNLEPRPEGWTWWLRSPTNLAFVRQYSSGIAAGVLTYTLNRVVLVAQPFILKRILRVLEEEDTMLAGVLWVAGLTLATLWIAVFHNTAFKIMNRLGTKARTCVMAAVYVKSLMIPSPQSVGSTPGQIVNLQSTDAANIFQMWQIMAFLLIDPLVILLSVVFVCSEVGWAGLTAVFLMGLLVPIQYKIAQSVGRRKRAMLRHTDERVRLSTEMVNGIRGVKQYGWEDSVLGTISKSRQAELEQLWKLTFLKAFNLAAAIIWPVLATMMTFFTYVWIHDGWDMTVTKAVTVLAFLALLRRPLNGLPRALASFTEGMIPALSGKASLLPKPKPRRRENRLLPEEMKTSEIEMAELTDLRSAEEVPSQEFDVVVNGASFSWSPSDAAPAAPLQESFHSASLATGEAPPPHVLVPRFDPRNPQQEQKSTAGSAESSGDPLSQEEERHELALRRIDFAVPRGSLVAVVGKVGSGKTALLLSLLGELYQVDDGGTVCCNPKVAYVSQVPWVLNQTLKDNILFGRPEEVERYGAVLDALCLRQDLEELPQGDLTHIGEAGVTLSGGQKARVATARAAYRVEETELYLLDDLFSALDRHVAAHVFEHLICGVLKETTRIIVLNSQLHLLEHFDYVAVMQDGKMVCMDRYEVVAELYPEVCSYQLDTSSGDEEEETKGDPDGALLQDSSEDEDESLDSDNLVLDVCPVAVPVDAGDAAAGDVFGDPLSQELLKFDAPEGIPRGSQPGSGGLMTAEDKKRGRVKWSVVTFYVKSAVPSWFFWPDIDSSAVEQDTKAPVQRSLPFTQEEEEGGSFCSLASVLVLLITCGVFGLYILSQAARIGCDLWLSIWAKQDYADSLETRHYMFIYAGMAATTLLLIIIRTLIIVKLNIQASQSLHDRLVKRLLRAPINLFYDVTPTGRILNRLSQDLMQIDVFLSDTLSNWLQNFFALLGIVVLSMVAVVWFGIAIIPLFYIFTRIQMYYTNSTRELKRLEGVSRSPIYSWFGASLTGLPSIRSYSGCVKSFSQTSRILINKHNCSYIAYHLSGRWLSLRLDSFSAVMVFIVGTMMVFLREDLSVALTGVALTYLIQLIGILQWTVKVTSETESHFTAVERVKFYEQEIPLEAPTRLDTDPAPEEWPRSGEIVFHGVKARYRPTLPYVLHDITAQIRGGEKIGIVGRTGSGKSSLFACLLRIIEFDTIDPLSPGITVDGYDIRKLGLRRLRSAISIIPQDPIILTGSLRNNLMPQSSGDFTVPDEELWRALELVGLSEMIQQRFRSPSSATAPRASDGRGGGEEEEEEDASQSSAEPQLDPSPSSPSDPLPPEVISELLDAHINAATLSQGQAQLLCCARALVRKTSIVLLDEASSRIDAATDKLLQQTLRDCFQHATVLIIAHRLATIAHCDRILVLQSGRVAEFDSPSRLLENPNGVYSRMINRTQGIPEAGVEGSSE